MSRIFKEGFLAAYESFADDGWSPSIFHRWSALSIVAAALERKVWLPWGASYNFYPNIYVLLVTDPGTGKSVASGRAVQVLDEMNARTQTITKIPNQVTEADFIQRMGHGRSFQIGTQIIFQNAGFYYASEASASLRNIFGDFIACLTDFYDCPDTWEKGTIKDGLRSLKNVCMNLLACTTFDQLGNLVNEKNIQGGFASRLIYVCYRHTSVKAQSFAGGMDDTDREEVKKYRAALATDLAEINKLHGAMRATPEFAKAWEGWWHAFENKRIGHVSNNVKSLSARTNTNLIKLAMLLSAAESNDMLLKEHHFTQARDMILEATAAMPEIFRESKTIGGTKTPDTIKHMIIQIVMKSPGITDYKLISAVSSTGHKKQFVAEQLENLVALGLLGRGATGTGGSMLKIVGNPDDYL